VNALQAGLSENGYLILRGYRDASLCRSVHTGSESYLSRLPRVYQSTLLGSKEAGAWI